MNEKQPKAGPSKPKRETSSPEHATPVEREDIDSDNAGSTALGHEDGTKVDIHRDEHQVLLDTKRSFVAYPRGQDVTT